MPGYARLGNPANENTCSREARAHPRRRCTKPEAAHITARSGKAIRGSESEMATGEAKGRDDCGNQRGRGRAIGRRGRTSGRRATLQITTET